MNFRRTTPAVLVLLASAAAMLAAPLVAAAKPTKRPGPVVAAKVRGELSGPAGTIGKVTARCPSGTSVVSGGVKTYARIEIDGDHTRVLIPYISRRSGRHAWTVSVYNAGDAIVNPKRFAAIAYCRRHLGRIIVKSRRGSVGVGSGGGFFPLANTYAGCPFGTRPMAGGYAMRLTPADIAGMATDGGPPGLIFGSRMIAGGWEVTLGRFSPGRSVIRSYAYCSKRRTKARSRTYYLTGLGQVRHIATPLCPRGTAAVSAGFYAPLVFRSQNNVSAVIPLGESRLSHRRWKISAVPISPSPSRTATYTYCG